MEQLRAMGMGGAAELPPEQEVGEERELVSGGMLKKKLLAMGEGYSTPEKGDEVTVHYTGRLTDGTKFDSSVDRGDPFVFTVGVGQVIKGWDEGVVSMRKGEKCLLTCAPDYAYGARGSPPTIPANATLEFEVELIAWKSVNDLNGDGTVVKRVVREGSGWEKPKDLDEVEVAYSVAGAGGERVVAETTAEFSLADGHLCAGLADVARSMKRGERALATLSGAALAPAPGGGAALPAAAAAGGELVATVELLGFRAVTKVTEDGGVTRKTLSEGEGYERPNEGATVRVVLEGAEQGEREWRTDEEEALAGLEKAVMQMKKGETDLVTIAPAYATPEALRPAGGAPGAPLVYTVTLVDFAREKESWEMDAKEKLEAAEAKKGAGNALFKAGRMERALRRYEKAASYIEHDAQYGEEEKAAARKLRVSILGNKAAVGVKLRRWGDVAKDCQAVLDLDAGNLKAHFRRGLALAGRGDHDDALAAFKRCLEIDPASREARAEYKRVRAKIAAQDKADMKRFGGMFDRMAKADTDEDQRKEEEKEEEKEED